MKTLKAMAIVLLCLIYTAQGMEVWGETRNPEKKFLINSDEQLGYSSLSNPCDTPLNIYHQKERMTGYDWLKKSKNLPLDVKKHIVGCFMQLFFRQQEMDFIPHFDKFIEQNIKDPEIIDQTELNYRKTTLGLEYLVSRFILLCRA